MNRSARMLLMNNRRKSKENYSDTSRGYTRTGYDDVEDKFRDRRGREHYDNGRYAPMNDSGMCVESRQGRDSRGRYTGARSHYDDGQYYHDCDEYAMENFYPMTPYVPPVYSDRDVRQDVSSRDYNPGRSRTIRPMNRIGFAVEGEMERLSDNVGTEYRTSADYENRDEMAYHTGDRSSGYGRSTTGNVVMDKEMAHEWLEHMENVDGTTGPHWTIEQTKRVMAQKGLQLDPVLFDLTMNMMYSDYNKVAKKLGVNNTDFYACMAEAFLTDPDSISPAEKLGNYYEYIVKH